MKQNKEGKPRLLARTLARELTPEQLEAVRGSARPPITTEVATLPDFNEDR